jgi:hypothetical protein
MPLSSLDLASPSQVIAAFEAGASANLSAQCRRRSIDHITGPGQLIATGDLHDHPVNFRAIVKLAGMEAQPDAGTAGPHATFHELIHSDKLIDGMDMSYRVLCRVAALKAAFPERVHALLANHEIAQVHGQGVSKNGVNCVKAFNAGVEYVFGSEAARVDEAIRGFIASMPLALRCTPSAGGRDVLCAHSLPGSDALDRFDPSVLERALTDGDFTPRLGSAHLMLWGRGQSEQELQTLADRWGVGLFLLGHESAPEGVAPLGTRALILNSDHDRGVCCRVGLERELSQSDALAQIVPLGTVLGEAW